MRMRKKANLEPRMEACAAWQVKDPVAMKGSWRSLYPQARELWVEIGCGKGKFTVETARQVWAGNSPSHWWAVLRPAEKEETL